MTPDHGTADDAGKSDAAAESVDEDTSDTGTDFAKAMATANDAAANGDDDEDDDEEFDDDAAGDPFAALGALFGGSAGANPLAGLLEQAQQMQAGMEDAQRRLAEQTVSGTSGGGLVRATVSGTGELQELRIDPSVVDPGDVETLADLIVAAVRAASEEARRLGERTMSSGLPDFGGPGAPDLAGLGLPNFGGLGLPSSVPDLGAGMIPGAGPVGRPLGDDDEGDDLGPSGAVRG